MSESEAILLKTGLVVQVGSGKSWFSSCDLIIGCIPANCVSLTSQFRCVQGMSTEIKKEIIGTEMHDPPVFAEMGVDFNITDQMERMTLVSIPRFS